METLSGTAPLTPAGDLSAQMRAGMRRFLERETERSLLERTAYWQRDCRSAQAYEQSVEPNRERFRRCIGVVDERVPVTALEYLATTDAPSLVARTRRYAMHAVRWPVLEGVYGEGLLLQPRETVRACVVALPDADQTPEMLVGLAPGIAPVSQFARRLAENGCQVLVPTLIDRQDTWSGTPQVWMTNQPHREWVYRPAYAMGRHIIGYEVQKVLAAVDWFGATEAPIGVAGYGEGGLLAFYSAAVDPRIAAVLVSGYCDSRQDLCEEPIYRNVFGLLREFGDAEIASLIAPRALIVEHSEAPAVTGPPPAREGRREFAAPGRLRTPELAAVRGELARLEALCPASEGFQPAVTLVAGPDGGTVPFGSEPALTACLRALGCGKGRPRRSGTAPVDARPAFGPAARQHRQLQQLLDHTQRLLARSQEVREAFWSNARPTSADTWHAECAPYREHLWDEIIGRVPPVTRPPNARTRRIAEQPHWTSYEVLLDVWEDVFAWGHLLVPRDIADGERRPVVVCQHGLEGLPEHVVTQDPQSPTFATYKGFAAQLADRGFVTFAPHNYYRGGNEFRQLQRMANPLKMTLFGITAAQHGRILEWLSGLPFVDPARIAFYGLSYGGNTAVRIPPLLEQYSAVITSGDFNEWIRKSASVHDRYSFPFYGSYEVFEFNLGNTFGHAELAALIAPRPFMVERGHRDGVAPDEWVALEYARVRRLYADLGIPERTEIEFFDGPHTINGQGTFAFLHRHLEWPAP